MKQAKLWSLGVVLVFASGAWAQQDEAPPPADVSSADTTENTAENTAVRALAVYEQGKQLYDAQDYAGALARFDEAAAIEPGKARWQYNRGLALRKLGRTEEARAALLQSRALEPDYKRAEIDDKLGEPGEPARDTGSHWIVVRVLGLYLLVGLFVWWFLRRMTRSHERRMARFDPDADSRKVEELISRLGQLSGPLIQVEHALRLGEDADLRALLNQATLAEQRVGRALEKAREDLDSLHDDDLEEQVTELGQQVERAVARARELFGEQALRPEGERVGCYFCARPLANPDFRMRVPLKRGAQVTEVLACPPCANMVAAGQMPPVLVHSANGQIQHWSELPGYDPYTHRHQPFPNVGTLPAWADTSSRSMAEVAAMAAGGALATGLAAYGVSRLLDLDNAGETAAAQAATQAAAKKAGERREERDWKDHS